MTANKILKSLTPERIKKELAEIQSYFIKIKPHLPQRTFEKLFSLTIKNPLDIVIGFKNAKDLMHDSRKRKNSVIVGFKNIKDFLKLSKQATDNFLILLSFCSKPIGCPSNRFSNKCITNKKNNICKNCQLYPLIVRLKQKKLSYYIITNDYLMIEKHLIPRFRRFQKSHEYLPLIATGCDMSIERFMALAVGFGSLGITYKFSTGGCQSNVDYKNAELGKKSVVTSLRKEDWQEIAFIVDSL